MDLSEELSITESRRTTPCFWTHWDATALKFGACASIEDDDFTSIKSLFQLNV
jgi:hypothetical protein